MSNEVHARHSERVEQSPGSNAGTGALRDAYVHYLFEEAAVRVQERTGESAHIFDDLVVSDSQKKSEPAFNPAESFATVLKNMRHVLTHQKPQVAEKVHEQH